MSEIKVEILGAKESTDTKYVEELRMLAEMEARYIIEYENYSTEDEQWPVYNVFHKMYDKYKKTEMEHIAISLRVIVSFWVDEAIRLDKDTLSKLNLTELEEYMIFTLNTAESKGMNTLMDVDYIKKLKVLLGVTG